jgi:anaerobic selenocysteine-containing dehydrogenase
MDRRDFFRILSATSGATLTSGCGSKTDRLIPLLVPEHEIVLGEEQWYPSVCTECSAGCGTLVRVMDALRMVERNGEQVRQPIAAAKKVEGNPLDLVSGGRLCARGQAAVQSLYHPDRLRGPMKRTGERGKAHFATISWDDGLALASDAIASARAADPSEIVALTRPIVGVRSLALQRFMHALGAPSPVLCSLADFAVEHKAAELVFGWRGLPIYDLANAHSAVGVGADFLGGWISPVYYGRQFGNFRQGRPNVRGVLVQAESRLSITAAAADQWLPLRPGSEPQFLAAMGHMLLDSGLARSRERLPPAVLEVFQSVDPGALLAFCGLRENRVRELVQALGESSAPLVIAGASIVQTNSVDAVVASHYVNLMLGNVGRQGGVLPPASQALSGFGDRRADEALSRARVVFLDDANPIYTLPRSSRALEALARAEMIISLSGFLDDSSAWADLLLPAHHTLESELALLPAVSPQPGVTIGTPFGEPLYDTRAPERLWSDLARRMKLDYQSVTAREVAQPFLSAGASFEDAAERGGAWAEALDQGEVRVTGQVLDLTAPGFDGDSALYPMQFQPYLSLQFHDGRGSNLPWLQELPDPASRSIWGLSVEIDTATARKLRIANGDTVRVQSPHGSIEAPAYIHPGAIPGVVSMAIGDGHQHYGRFASGRGANPISILAPVWENSTGALALGATRVRLARVDGPRKWIQFSAPDREEREFGHR